MAKTKVQFQTAQRGGRFARIGIYAMSGGGKTLTGLEFGTWMAEQLGGRLAVIDTERGSSALYAPSGEDDKPGVHEYDFDVFYLEGPYNAQSYINAIEAAENSPEHKVLLIDSGSPLWNGTGGVLETSDQLKKTKFRGDGFRAMAAAKKQIYNPWVEAIIDANIHIVVTLRTKHAYAIGKDENDRTTIERLGLDPRMEESFIYELDLVGNMSDGTWTTEKTRFVYYDGKMQYHPDGEFIRPFFEWVRGQDDPYVYGDGKPVPNNAATRRLFNEYKQAHDGQAPFSGTNLSEWYRKEEEAAAPSPNGAVDEAAEEAQPDEEVTATA